MLKGQPMKRLLGTLLLSKLLVLGLAGCETKNVARVASHTGEKSAPSAVAVTSRSKGVVTENKTQAPPTEETTPMKSEPAVETTTLGAGCFWCIEAVLEQVEGISDVTSGYMGGAVENPTYEQICTGLTGHVEVVQVTFDPQVIGFAAVLEQFWKLHDPTTLNRQGNDVGTQYRSAIFYHSPQQLQVAEKSKKEKEAKGVFRNPIVTEITKVEKFYPAEKYHQDYYRNNKAAPYCRFIITPKLDELGLEK